MDFSTTLAAFLMVVVANSTPWFIGRLLGQRFAYPLDCQLSWPDGIRILGGHKTWRGVSTAILACAVAGGLLGFGAVLGTKFGMLAMIGDALSSAIKRRLRLAPGAEVFGLDQLPEVLLPLAYFAAPLHLNSIEVAAIAIAFVTLDAMTSRLRHKA